MEMEELDKASGDRERQEYIVRGVKEVGRQQLSECRRGAISGLGWRGFRREGQEALEGEVRDVRPGVID